MLDFMHDKFEYFIISAWMAVFVAVVIHMIHHGSDKGVDWALNAFSALLGALLGLIQGKRMAGRTTDVSKIEDKNNVVSS